MFTIKVKTNWQNPNRDGVWLLPDINPITVSFSPAYDGLGCFDYDLALDQMQEQVRQAWGLPLDLRQQDTDQGGVLESLKQIVLENLVRQDPEVLRDFSLDSDALTGATWGMSLPLVMAGSSYKFSIDCSTGEGGAPEAAVVVDALAGAYGQVFQVPGGEVFGSSQRGALLAKASEWAQGLMDEAGLGLPKVEVNLQSGGWVDSSLRLWVDVYKDQVEQYSLTIPASQRGELDFAGIDDVAAEIARDLGQGREGDERLCAKIAEQIGPDAREYATWIIEVENNIRAEFWKAMNKELEGHLKQAEKLHEAAKKWRKDYDEWVKAGGSGSLEVEENAPKENTKYTISVWEIPGQLLSDFKKIWNGLRKLPGAVKKGVGDHSEELINGTILGFRMADVVIDEARSMAIRAVGIATIIENFEEMFGSRLNKKWEGKVGGRRAQLRGYGYNLATFIVGRFMVYYEVKQLQRDFPELAMRVNNKILDIIKEVKMKKDSNEN